MLEMQIPFFDSEKIAVSGQCFRWQRLAKNRYRIPAFGQSLTLTQQEEGRIQVDCSLAQWDSLWARYFDMDGDYPAWTAAIDPTDDYLQAAAVSARGVRVLRQPLWETLASFLISQNNNIPRIQKSLRLLCKGAEEGFVSPDEIAQASPEMLREAGLGYRAPYLQAAARRYLRDGLTDGSSLGSLGEARAYLQSYQGVGPKVADCVCLYGLGLKDAFPMDVWVKRILSRHYEGVFPLMRYEGFSGVLQQWMFYYERETEGKLHP